MTSNYYNAVDALKTAKTVDEWNDIRSKHVDSLTTEELAHIDSSGLIVKVLGQDELSK